MAETQRLGASRFIGLPPMPTAFAGAFMAAL